MNVEIWLCGKKSQRNAMGGKFPFLVSLKLFGTMKAGKYTDKIGRGQM